MISAFGFAYLKGFSHDMALFILYFVFYEGLNLHKIKSLLSFIEVRGTCIIISLLCSKQQMSRFMRKPTFWFPTWPYTNQTVQLQKMAGGLKFRIEKVEGLHCLSSENKGADQLRGNCEADLRLCFRICKTLVFS